MKRIINTKDQIIRKVSGIVPDFGPLCRTQEESVWASNIEPFFHLEFKWNLDFMEAESILKKNKAL